MHKTPQIAEEQLVMTMDKTYMQQSFKDTKVSVSVFSADISKSEEISRWRPINKTSHCDFSALRRYSKITTIVYQKDWHYFKQWGQQEVKRSILQDYNVTDTHT